MAGGWDPAQLRRLASFLDETTSGCFGRPAQRDACRRYCQGLLSDAPRKNMSGAWRRLPDPGHYQALQHFITHARWDAEPVWRHIRGLIPGQRGIVIVDDTGFPKQGTHSAGVKRQYSGTLGKVGNCQVGVSTVVYTNRCTWPGALDLYMPEEWMKDEERLQSVGVPKSVRFQKKWEIALGQIGRVRDAGIEIECVVADAGYGEVREFQDGLDATGLPYVIAVPGSVTVFVDGKGPGMKRTLQQKKSGPQNRPIKVQQLADLKAPDGWTAVTWGRGTKGPLKGKFFAMRVTLPRDGRRDKDAKEYWLLCERPGGDEDDLKFHLSNLPEKTPLVRLVRLAHTRWPVEKSYQDMKQELGLDDFQGRGYAGFHHHAVLTALSFTFLQLERCRSKARALPSLPEVRRMVTWLLTLRLIAENASLRRQVLAAIKSCHPP